MDFVDVVPLLLRNRDLLSHFGSVGRIDVAVGDCWVFVKSHQHFSEGINDCGMCPGLVDRWVFFELCDADSD